MVANVSERSRRVAEIGGARGHAIGVSTMASSLTRIPVRNVHERRFAAPAEQVGALLDTLASPGDRLWPSLLWPPMRFDRPLQIGAIGGHGPVRYQVDAYEPGRSVRFALRAPRGFDGFHGFEVIPAGARGTKLRHVLEMNARGRAMLTWPAIVRPLHDALVEDCLDNAAFALGETTRSRNWSLWVRILRAGFRHVTRRRAPAGAV
jgi:hypothetical protein